MLRCTLAIQANVTVKRVGGGRTRERSKGREWVVNGEDEDVDEEREWNWNGWGTWESWAGKAGPTTNHPR